MKSFEARKASTVGEIQTEKSASAVETFML